jgi:hypothetical protein
VAKRKTAAYSLPEDLIERVKQESPNSASANLERILRSYFGRKPTAAELADAIRALADMAGPDPLPFAEEESDE